MVNPDQIIGILPSSITSEDDINTINNKIGNVDDTDLPIDLQGKTIVEMVKQNFTRANEAKLKVITAMGSTSLAITNTFDEISAELTSFVATATNSSVKKTKLNMTAGSTHQEVLSKVITLEELCTSVLHFVSVSTSVTEYTCSFDNTDKNNFIYPSTVDFNGTMYLLDKNESITYTESPLGDGSLYVSNPVDVTTLHSLSTIDGTSTDPIVISATNFPACVTAKKDIDLTGITNLTSINWTNVVSGGGVLKLAISVDGGTTWKAFNGTSWNTLDITNLSAFKSNGMAPSVVSALTSANLELLRGSSLTIRFAYYLEKNDVSDVANNDKIELIVTMPGYNEIAAQTAFSYSLGADMRTITYTINTAGTYTFIYADKA